MAGTTSFRYARRLAFEAQNGACFYCGRPMWSGRVETREEFAARMGIAIEDVHDWQCTGDHVIPKSRAPHLRPRGNVAACRRCNEHKADRAPDEWAGSPWLRATA
jgi:5-methylcytosine-specific restriction endonuclease McrA